ncbi:NADPH-dependent FMN reductase [Haladaptatus sp. R4]|uniref:NADPH-dependent FMN reductase n=1 Tax=Haladaptatus sp. R4 TaxID=1679489 RepID=UPI0009EE003C|nr:NADPH-dependent FMN reductase [Haladaptatus sp. R4]
MQRTPNVIAVCGSMRDGSHTRTALKHVLDAAEAEGAETELIDPREYDLPIFDPDEEEPEDAVEIKRKIREADSVIIGSPVYHGSYTSAFRNVHDYCSFDEFEDTTVGLLAVAGGGSYGSTLDHMRITVRGVHGWVLPHQVGIRNAYEQFDDDEFVDGDLEARVRKLGEQAVKYAFLDPNVTSSEADEEVADEAAADD